MTEAPATRALSRHMPAPARDVLLASLAAAPTTVDATGELDAADVIESFDLVKAPRADVTFLGHSDTVEVPSVRPEALAVAFDASLAASGSAPETPEEILDTPRASRDASLDDDAFFARAEPISTGAVTFELDDTARATAVRAPRRLGWVVAICLAAACTLVVSAAITERVSGGAASASTVPVSFEATPRAANVNASASNASVNASSADATPTIDVKSLRPALVGTLVAPTKGVLYIDGKRAEGATALVTCGRHVVRLGARGKARAVDVPCGGRLALR